MHALWVWAHPHASSLNGRLREIGTTALTEAGWSVDELDLYREGFDPLLVEVGGADVRRDQERLRAADLLVMQFPLWWYSTPAILKGWIDRVFESGFAFDVPDPETGKPLKYGTGGLAGKRALTVVTAGDRSATLGPRGISGDIEDVLWPLLHGTFWYTGMDPLRPHLVTEANDVSPETMARLEADLTGRLENVMSEQRIGYRHMCDEHYDHTIKLHDSVAPGEVGLSAHREG
ncbi:NAD(P)H dehydrogenase (quinone) [Nocardioides luteus]|uniref:NAD(P)H dehydrogenase n=1 Tax=Nocardioides luteus TaxID=1844 RepID=A0ABQ5T1I6_9ACTN|nr:NAD(P)H-dependent oxidoreductase [Nocardioides luteus]MDR7311454.1 NAD(P)H dehydrogenase (quinone) [Nocardioides luteus]GGR55489.1 NAD(P)H dehydrogenase [Nocardioides luteus]GLJ70104.1 NAD(P)H dehydrogenase [Nocardioides luteus]